MTLRSLSSEHRSHRLIDMILAVLLAFFECFVFTIILNNARLDPNLSQADILRQLYEAALPGYPVFAIILPVAAAFALSAYHYLFQKSMVDYYHALPVTRSKMYHIINRNSIMIYMIPTLLVCPIQYGIATFFGYGDIKILYYSLFAWGMYLLTFLVCYYTMVLAILLTGNVTTSLMGFGIFCVYAPMLLRFLPSSYASTFFNTYTAFTSQATDSFYGNVMLYLSPVTLSMKFGGMPVEIGKNSLFLAGIHILIILVLSLICHAIYLKRPSEAAGKAMAFGPTKSIIRFLIVLPISLYAGLGLYFITMESSILWLLIGIALGTILLHGFIEAVYASDVKGAFHHPIQMLLTILIACAISAIFWMDIFGYDTYLPKEKDIAYMTVRYLSSDCYTFEETHKPLGIAKEDQQKVLEYLAERQAGKEKKELDDMLLSSSENTTEYYTDIQVSYRLKNHLTLNRAYNLTKEETKELLAMLYSSKEFKYDTYPVFSFKPEDITIITLSDYGKETELAFTDREKDEFLNIFKSEFASLSTEDIQKAQIINTISFSHVITREPYSNFTDTCSDTYYIYDCYTKTIDYLEARGYEAEKPLKEAPILSITAMDYYIDLDEETDYETSDPAIIEKATDYLLPCIYSDPISSLLKDHSHCEVILTLKNANTEEGPLSCTVSNADREAFLALFK